MATTISHKQMRELVQREADRLGGGQSLAKEMDVSSTFIYHVLKGVLPVSVNLAAKLGYRKVELEPVFERLEKR